MAGGILSINGGSSSVKFAVFARGPSLQVRFRGSIKRIGLANSTLQVRDAAGKIIEDQEIAVADQNAAASVLVDWLDQHRLLEILTGVGHRVVHGGARFQEPALVTNEMRAELRKSVQLDPDHLPGEIALIEAVGKRCADVPQIACFDTSFHRSLPRVARLLPIPRRYEAAGVRRYGFHGLSFEFLMQELERVAGADAARGRVVLAHLGAGASLAAVRDGQCIDTTMGFTPTAGLMMATRSGDLDPGLLAYLMREEKMGAAELDELVNRHSGLAGVSEISSDMRELLDMEANDPRAADAVALFCYLARKWIGAMAAALNGVETLVFSGGIGENAPEIRSRICEGLGHLGVEIDEANNQAGRDVISVAARRVTVRVIATDEELLIARVVSRMLDARKSN